MRHPGISALAALAFIAISPAAAQTVPPASPALHDRAVAAGYKAAILCSALFNATATGATRTRESVEAHELHGIYPEYDPMIAGLPATIEPGEVAIAWHDAKPWETKPAVTGARVAVRFTDAMPPRVAVPGATGCTLLPIGADPNAAGEIYDHRPLPRGAPASTSPFEFTSAPPRGDARALAAAVARAFDPNGYGEGTDTVATLVVQDGRIVSERYALGYGPDTPTRTWSVAKSIAGTIVGAAVKKGLIDPAAPTRIPEWQNAGDPRAKITLDNLLRMASGLHSDTAGNRTDDIYFGGTAVTEQAVAWPLEAPPGARFRYANDDILLAIRALRARYPAKQDGAFPYDLLISPLGMRQTFAERDWRGNFILSSQVWTTPRDLARLGMFWLADGVWQGTRLLPEGWMKYMTTPSGPQPASGPGYGATMWLFGPAQGLPEGSYAAQGNRGQYVMVIPSKKLVIVRRGEDPGKAYFYIAKFAADVAAALP